MQVILAIIVVIVIVLGLNWVVTNDTSSGPVLDASYSAQLK